jgi:hypothetical protein
VPERGSGRREWREKSYPGDFRRLLRAGRERRGKDCEARDESAAVH